MASKHSPGDRGTVGGGNDQAALAVNTARWMTDVGLVSFYPPKSATRMWSLSGAVARCFLALLLAQCCLAAEAKWDRHALLPWDPVAAKDLPSPPGPVVRPDEEPGVRPGEGPGVRPGVRPGEGPGVRPDEGPGVRPGVRPSERPRVRPGESGRQRLEARVFGRARAAAWAKRQAAALQPRSDGGPADVAARRDPAVWLGRLQGGARGKGEGQGETGALSSVPTALAETAELRTPAAGKPLGLLSKASWSKAPSFSRTSSSSSSSKPKVSPPMPSIAVSTANQMTDADSVSPAGPPAGDSGNTSSSSEESVSNLPAWDLPTLPESLLPTPGDHDITLPPNVTSPFSTHKWNATAPARTASTAPPRPTSAAPARPSPVTAATPTPPSPTADTVRPPHDTGLNTVTTGSLQPTTPAPTATVRLTASLPAATSGSDTLTDGTSGAPAADVTSQQTISLQTALAEAPPTPTAAATTTTTTTTTSSTTTTNSTTTTASTTTAPTTTLPSSPPSTTPTTTATTTTTRTTTSPATPTTPAATATTTTTAVPATTGASTTEVPATTRPAPVQTTPAPTSTTEAPTSISTEEAPLPCNVTEKYWVKTVLSLQLRRNRLDLILKQNLSKGLSHALQRALNDTSVYVQVERDECSPHNVTLGYYVASGKMVYISSAVVEALNAYGFDKLLSDIRQHTPLVKAVLVSVATWLPTPSVHLQLKTVLRFVGPTDNVYSCSFVQMLEQRLEKAFDEAQDKVLETYSSLTVEIQSVFQERGSPSVSVVYIVRNQDAVLNGTVSSGLLNQLTAELVGYFLFYPPLVIAEPLEYHNLNTSLATKNYWVITVIHDVDGASLEANYQSFANLMEQRLAELFLVAGRQGSRAVRSRRATTVGGYTVQMVGIRRLPGPKNPAEMTYYTQLNGAPLTGMTAAKTLSTLDSQTMALTLGYFVQVQAEPVIKMDPSNLWLMAVLTPVFLLMVVIGMVAFILCKRNRVIFKTNAFRTFKTRSKTSYRREGSYHHQPVQGFDYAKKHMGRTGDESISVTKETLVLGLPVRDAPLSLDRKPQQDGTANKRPPSADMHKGGRLPSEEAGSVSSGGSGKLNTGKTSSSVRRAVATSGSMSIKEELHKRSNTVERDPYEEHSGSLRLITIKPMTAQPTYSYPSSSSHSQDSVVLNGEVNHVGLKQKADIEHYRNKLRQKARKKGYGEFSLSEGGSHGYSHRDARHGCHDNGVKEPMTAEEKRASFAGCHKRYSHPREPAYWSRQSLSSPSPIETEMDLLVLRERSRRGIRNNGYDAEPEPFVETNVDRLMSSLGYPTGSTGTGNGSLGVKGHCGSDSSSLSSQPSIDEVRTQMHMLLGNAFSLAPPDHPPPSPPINSNHRHLLHHAHSALNPSHSNPYSDGVTSAPGTMNHPCGSRQRGITGYVDMHQCSLPKPGFRFTQLPDISIGPPPPLIPSRPGPPPGTSIRRSTPDVSLKPRIIEATELQGQQPNGVPYLPLSRAPFPAVTVDQSISTYSGNPITAVYAISANRPGYSDYFVMSPPSSYRSPSWMSYPPEPEDLPRQWSDTPNSRHLETIC